MAMQRSTNRQKHPGLTVAKLNALRAATEIGCNGGMLALCTVHILMVPQGVGMATQHKKVTLTNPPQKGVEISLVFKATIKQSLREEMLHFATAQR